MENEDIIDNIKTLSDDIEHIKQQTKRAKEDLHNTENLLKAEEAKKNCLEVNLDELQQSVNFYKLQVAKISKELVYKKKIYSKFQLATEYHKRVIAMYEETLKPEDEKINDLGCCPNNDQNIHQEIEKYKIITEKNLQKINDLLLAVLPIETKENQQE